MVRNRGRLLRVLFVMAKQVDSAAFMKACASLIPEADCSDATASLKFALCFSVDDGRLIVWRVAFGAGVSVVVSSGRLYGDIRIAGYGSIGRKQARALAADILRAEKWTAELDDFLTSFDVVAESRAIRAKIDRARNAYDSGGV